jgi:hypothetical protein
MSEQGSRQGSRKLPAAARVLPTSSLPQLAGPGTRLFVFLCAVVVLAPLPLGATPPLAGGILALAVAVGLAWSAALPFAGASALPRDIAVPGVLFGLVLCWVVIQTAAFTPAGWHAAVWREAGEAIGRTLPGAIAVDRQAPLTGLVRLISYAGVFYVTWRLGSDARRGRSAIAVVAISGCAYAAYGLIAFWAGNTRVLWLAKQYYPLDLTGTFLNRDHFATYLGLVLLSVMCHVLERFEALQLYGSWRSRLALLFEFLGRHSWHLLALFLVATALVSTHSRGGFIAAAAGLFALGAALALVHSVGQRASAAWLAAVALLVLVAVAVSGGPTLARLLGTDINAEERLAVWKLVLTAIANHPLAGTGLGSFPMVFPGYRTAEVLNFYTRAHDDYLENLLELGIPAALCLFAALIWLAGLCLLGVRRRHRDAMLPGLGFAASVLVGVHALTDFSLQVPAVTTVYMFLLGIGVAQSRSPREGLSARPGQPRTPAASAAATRTPE